jgi:hypothetical protein
MLRFAAASGVLSLPGCGIVARDPVPVCPSSSDVSLVCGPLTIDAHCHVFNGTDLQIGDFLSKVAFRQGGALGAGVTALGAILQELAWSLAPDGTTEMAALNKVAERLSGCNVADARSVAAW